MQDFKPSSLEEISSNELRELNGGWVLFSLSETQVRVYSGILHEFVDFTEGLMSGYNHTKH